MIGAYYRLIKPGVMYGNLLTTMAGFLLASKGIIDWGLFMSTVTGTALVISSACVINNFLDQDIDAVMSRTKNRPLITGEVSGRGAFIFGTILGLLGLFILIIWTNWWVVGAGVFGWVVYVWLYGALSKRRSRHGTLVGSVSGAVPIFAGYVAVTNGVDLGAVLVFAILFIWQMPEFYSIAIYRRDEYQKAKVPVMSVVKGVRHTKQQILGYLVAFFVATLSLSIAGYTGGVYFVVMFVLCLYWLWLGVNSLKSTKDNYWSRKVFRHSLIILLVFSFLISIDAWLP